MTNASTMRLVGWAAPVVCMIFAGTLVYLQFQRVNAARNFQDSMITEQEDLEGKLLTLQSRPKPTIELASPETAREEGDFVQLMKQLASKNAVMIDSLRNNPPQAGKTIAGMEGVQPIDSEIDLRGPYFGIRQFVTDLRTQSRVYVLQDAAWQNQKGESQLTLKVQRYVRKTKT